jgi:hypothetical protein
VHYPIVYSFKVEQLYDSRDGHCLRGAGWASPGSLEPWSAALAFLVAHDPIQQPDVVTVDPRSLPGVPPSASAAGDMLSPTPGREKEP